MIGEHRTAVPGSLQRLLTDGTMTGLSEAQLLERFLTRGDQAAFEAIVMRHGPMVLGVCRRLLGDPHDVEDAFQATFLILLRKAGSIRDRRALGTWLYGVARRVAVRLRTDARRRRAREIVGATEIGREAAQLGWEEATELREILDEEVSRLTDKFRSPVVLCDLEGQSLEQAAASLRCPVGTVKSRLSRARQKLRSRLVRRGLSPSTGFLAATLAPEPAGALPVDLVASTINAATHLAAGRTVSAGVVSATVAALLNDTSRSMSMNALKLIVVILTASGIVATSAGVLAFQTPRAARNETVVAQRKPAPYEKKALDEPVKEYIGKKGFEKAKAEEDLNQVQSIASLAEARVQTAEQLFQTSRNHLKTNPHDPGTRQAFHEDALWVLQARRDASNTKADQVHALENYVNAMKELEESEQRPADDIGAIAMKYRRLEAELWLAQAKAGKEPSIPGSGFGGQPGSGPGTQPGAGPAGRPGTDPRSVALLARLEEPVPMSFPNPTPLGDVLKYIQQATAGGPNGDPIPIYVDPVNPGGDSLNDKNAEELMKTPITIDLVGVPLRRSLKLIAEQLGMGVGIRDGMVTMRPPDMRFRNWHELLVLDESFPQSSPLDLEVERARRGELTAAELDELNERLKAIDEVTKHYRSIRMMGGPMPGGMQARPQSAANPAAQPGR